MHRSGRLVGLKLGSVLFVAGVLAACGGGGGSSDSPATSTTPQSALPPGSGTANAAPSIQGQPSGSVLAGQNYVFRPSASDANGDSLTFSATNLPSWITLNASTGELSGTPTAAQVATYSNITITVSDGQGSSTMGPFSIAVTQAANGSAVVSWMAPAVNTDGSALQDLAGYRLMYGRAANDLVETITINNPSLSSYVVENLSPGTWYFALVTVNAQGMNSAPSSVVSKAVM